VQVGERAAEGFPEQAVFVAGRDVFEYQVGMAVGGAAVAEYFGGADSPRSAEQAQALGFGFEHGGGLRGRIRFYKPLPAIGGAQAPGAVDVAAGERFGVGEAGGEGCFEVGEEGGREHVDC